MSQRVLYRYRWRLWAAIVVRAGGVVEILVGIIDAIMTSGDEWASIEKYPER
jgi:hypothetical protein